MDRGTGVFLGFDCDLAIESIHDLDELLESINYLGRSESWVSAQTVVPPPIIEWNCLPADGLSAKDKETARVATVLPPGEFAALASRPSGTDWLDALCFSTRDLLKKGWSDPPALKWVDYFRPPDALSARPPRKMYSYRPAIRCAKYALSSKVLPRIQETISFAERIRGHLMGIHKKLMDQDPALVSQRFSGKDSHGRPLRGHEHAFYLPLDEDGDGRLDHLLVYAREPFNATELQALDRLRSVWQPDGRPDVRIILVNLTADIPGIISEAWVSATPFVTRRHYRKGRGEFGEWLAGEVSKECSFHGLPLPEKIQWIPRTLSLRHSIRWFEFMRGRKGEIPPHGYGCVLDFGQSVKGPFAIGSGCHFGLGLFVPSR